MSNITIQNGRIDKSIGHINLECIVDNVFDYQYVGHILTKKCVQGRDVNDHDEKVIAMIVVANKVCCFDIQAGHRLFCGRAERDTDFVKSIRGCILNARYVNVN